MAEAWRGGPRQSSPARMLAGWDMQPVSAEQARHAGELAGRALPGPWSILGWVVALI